MEEWKIRNVKDHIRICVNYPGHDAVKNVVQCGDNKLDMWLKTSLTWEEIEDIRIEYEIVEIYGFDPEHFDGLPKAREELGLIVEDE